MNAGEDGTGFARAETIVAQSRLTAVLERSGDRALAAARTSRSVAAVRQRIDAFRSLPASARRECVGTAIVAAVAGHVVIAWMLPLRSTPVVALTAPLLVAMCLAAAAALRSLR